MKKYLFLSVVMVSGILGCEKPHLEALTHAADVANPDERSAVGHRRGNADVELSLERR